MARYHVTAKVTITKTHADTITARTKGEARKIAQARFGPQVQEALDPDEEVQRVTILGVDDIDLPDEGELPF